MWIVCWISTEVHYWTLIGQKKQLEEGKDDRISVQNFCELIMNYITQYGSKNFAKHVSSCARYLWQTMPVCQNAYRPSIKNVCCWYIIKFAHALVSQISARKWEALIKCRILYGVLNFNWSALLDSQWSEKTVREGGGKMIGFQSRTIGNRLGII